MIHQAIKISHATVSNSMNKHRILMIVLMTAAVCIAGAGVGAAEDVNVTFEGHFGGLTYATAVSINYAYVGQGQDLVVLDMSNPSQPLELGRIDTLGLVYDINISGSYAYVADRVNYVIWPAYVDKGNSRSGGRVIPRKISVTSPELREVVQAAKELGLNSTVERNKTYPKSWWKVSGRVLVDKNGFKSGIVRETGENRK